MSKIFNFPPAAFPVILFLVFAGAEANPLLASNPPAAPAVNAISAGLRDSATAQLKTDVSGYTDFDAVSSVNDPLYREGSKELLKETLKNDGSKKAPAGAALRDAPISKDARQGAAIPAKAKASVKKAKAGKPLHSDPVKAKNTF